MNQVKILYAEDDQRTAQLVREFLELQNYLVAIADDGVKAIELIRNELYDCVLLDITMPKMDGLAVCKLIRTEYSGGIMMLTARGDESDQVVGLDSGADDYLPKPVQPRLLLARLNALMRRSRSYSLNMNCQPLTIGDIQIDSNRRVVTYLGSAIHFSSTEFDLLLALARQAGTTVSRKQLHQTVRGVRYDGLDRSIDLMIARLRRKLGDSGRDARLIKSVHGTGYQLVKK